MKNQYDIVKEAVEWLHNFILCTKLSMKEIHKVQATNFWKGSREGQVRLEKQVC